MTGWQSLSAVDDVTLADFTPTAGSTTLNGLEQQTTAHLSILVIITGQL